MPRYFIDSDGGDLFVKDDQGSEFVTIEAARMEAIDTASGIARDLFTSGGGTRVCVVVRNGGEIVFEVEVLLRTRKFGADR
jgi:hypothetical protein